MAWIRDYACDGVCKRCDKALLRCRIGIANIAYPESHMVADGYCDGCGCTYLRQMATAEDLAA